jgi:hypothetical protein
MQGEGIDQPGEGKDPQHLLLRRGEQQLTPALASAMSSCPRNATTT